MSKRFWSFVIIILISIGVSIAILRTRTSNQLKRNGIITTGYVYEVFDAFRSKNGFKYYFYHNGKKYFGKSIFQVGIAIKDEITNKSIPVIFNPKDPDNSKLLLTKPLFENYGIPYPDSLRWVEKFTYY